MPEVRDPGLKLFGKTIPLLESQEEAVEEIGFRPAGFSVEEKKSSAIETSSSEEGAMEFERRDEPDESSEMDASSTVCCENDEEGAVAMEGTKSEQGKRKTLPKPDKILPCPRCNSSNTKFCYYNNYNVNQPRHFCKNCQRYWTAGGTMRNVPVGAGRRKNKHAALHRRPAKAAGCGEVIDNAVEPSCASSTLTASHGVLSEATDNAAGEENTAGIPPPPFHCYPWSMAAAAPPPPFCGAAVPFPLLPAFFWSSCMAGWQNSATWVGSDAAGGPMPAPEKTKGSLWVPKTLRIGDPDEAAKSSIWATLGIKPDLKTCNGGIFRGFDHKPVVDRVAMEGVPVNHVNPAALSRSQAFKEST